jgi:hypothetical protein
MRYGSTIGTGSALVWGLAALVVGLIGLVVPMLLVVIALALTIRAVMWMRRTGGTGTLG